MLVAVGPIRLDLVVLHVTWVVGVGIFAFFRGMVDNAGAQVVPPREFEIRYAPDAVYVIRGE